MHIKYFIKTGDRRLPHVFALFHVDVIYDPELQSTALFFYLFNTPKQQRARPKQYIQY